jgi:4-aminobutyrate aminotransferase/diaminobutyrate-pyruvate transaminase/4-aminobutyrate aminotransferase/(S)-3-amino-2-methylpropionate transaminase
VDGDRTFVQVPFPDGFRNTDTSFDVFLKTLEERNIRPEDIAGVMCESYQGGGPDFLPVEYAQKLEAFCRKYDIVLAMDEVQAGFGRSGKWFSFEHYNIKPDLIPCGKGISSSLPISAVIGRRDIMDLYAPGSMTSTHSGSPLCVAAALENLKILKEEKLVENAARMGEILQPELRRIQQKYADRLTWVGGRGLVAGIRCTKGDKEPDPETSLKINLECLYRGLLMFAPVGKGGECVKIAPPLTIKEDMLRESIAVLEEACDAVLGK